MRLPAAWRRLMLTSVALTLRACWALEQVKASSWTILKFNFKNCRWCQCLCYWTRLADCGWEAAVQRRWCWEWRTGGEHTNITATLIVGTIFNMQPYSWYLWSGPKRPAGKHGNYLCSRDGADSVVFWLDNIQQGKELLNQWEFWNEKPEWKLVWNKRMDVPLLFWSNP